MKLRALLGLVGLGLAAAVLLTLTIGGVKAARGRGEGLAIGSKTFSESWILAEIYAQRIERVTGEPVRRRHALGGTLLLFEGLRSGALDLYPEYTGTGLVTILGREVPDDPATVLPIVREAFEARYGMTWLSPQGFNNTYAMAMPRAKAEALGVETVSDLRGHPELTAGFATEFVARDDGWPGLAERYGLSLDREPRAMEAGLMYQAAASGEVDLISAYGTDARIDKFDLFVLEDDRQFFPPYRATPLLAPGVADAHPEIGRALAPLAGLLDDVQMRKLNGEVDIHKRDPSEVAAQWLDAQGL